MKLGEIVKIKGADKKKYICKCCKNVINMDEIGIVGNNGFVICKSCAPEVDRRRITLYETYTEIHKRYPTQEDIDGIYKIAVEGV